MLASACRRFRAGFLLLCLGDSLLTAPAVVRRLEEVFARRERGNPHAVHASRVTGRNDDGTLQLQRVDGECVARGCATAEGVGEIVRRPAGPCWQNQGTSGVALAEARGTGRVLWVQRIEPSFYAPGESYTVTVTGRGLSQATVFDFLLPASEEVTPYIVQTAQRFVDAQTIEIDIDVDPLASAVVTAALAYDDAQVPS